MRIRAKELRRLVESSDQGIEAIVGAVARPGLDGQKAASALGNWMSGRDHPRCKARDIETIARTLGCEVSDIAIFTSMVKHHRGSPRKARLLADLIRGKKIEDARNLLTFTPKRAALDLKKALDAAITDAEQYRADPDLLFVADSRVDEGPTLKRFKEKDRGRAHPIMKRTSHITVGVQERD